jgi:hypothetical protein
MKPSPYQEALPDFPQLADALDDVDRMFRSVSRRMRSIKNPPNAQEQRLYLALIDKRVSLLTAAGLTPKAKRYLMGVALAPSASREDQEADEEDDKFLDS